ncbi:MAG: hypothetical protein AB7E52_06810, partial [Bdellovibrionales bacterium]
MKDFLSAHKKPLHKTLEEIDLVALENVRNGHGGPFAAQLVLITLGADNSYTVKNSFPVTTNKVLESGIASQHAEAQSLCDEHMGKLTSELRRIKEASDETPVVLLFSSAQPCFACLAKIEIGARFLVHEGLIEPKHFVLIYGADYQATEQIAGFQDYAYALDLCRFVKTQGAIPACTTAVEELPPFMRQAVHDCPDCTAFVVRQEKIIGQGKDRRKAENLFQTAECMALYAASQTLKQEGHPCPWNLQGSQLYTFTTEIGPLTYTECQWAGIEKIIQITGRHAVHPNECATCDNAQFLT